MPENKKEIKKEIEKVVDNEMEKQNVSLTDDQKKAVVALVGNAVEDEAVVGVTGGIDKKTAVNVGTHIAVALLGAGLGSAATFGVAKACGYKFKKDV